MEKFFAAMSLIIFSGIIIEMIYARKKGKNWYSLSDLFTNLNISAGHLFWGLLVTPIILGGYHLIHSKLGYGNLKGVLSGWSYYVVGYLLTDFIVYWNHRFSHVFNGLIAGHITHHSSEHFNMSTAVRVNWIYRGYSWLAFAPLALMGFAVKDFLMFQLIINGINGICHTRFDFNIGPLKYILLTPQYHRIHHCSNDEYYDKNFGGSLIIWDRLFGTFAEKQEGVDYQFGLKENLQSSDPITVNFHYFMEMARDARREQKSFFRKMIETGKRTRRLDDDAISDENFAKRWFFIPAALFAFGAFFTAIKGQLDITCSLVVIAGFTLITSMLVKSIITVRKKSSQDSVKGTSVLVSDEIENN